MGRIGLRCVGIILPFPLPFPSPRFISNMSRPVPSRENSPVPGPSGQKRVVVLFTQKPWLPTSSEACVACVACIVAGGCPSQLCRTRNAARSHGVFQNSSRESFFLLSPFSSPLYPPPSPPAPLYPPPAPTNHSPSHRRGHQKCGGKHGAGSARIPRVVRAIMGGARGKGRG